MKKVIAVLLVVCLLLGGCASIVSESNYPLQVTSNPAGARISVTNRRGLTIYEGKTPATMSLNAGSGYFKKERYTMVFEAPGYSKQTITLNATIDGWYFGNILLGGLVGMLIVDPATGAMWKLPPNVAVSLSQQPTSSNADGTLKVYDISQIPDDVRGKLIRIR